MNYVIHGLFTNNILVIRNPIQTESFGCATACSDCRCPISVWLETSTKKYEKYEMVIITYLIGQELL